MKEVLFFLQQGPMILDMMIPCFFAGVYATVAYAAAKAREYRLVALFAVLCVLSLVVAYRHAAAFL